MPTDQSNADTEANGHPAPILNGGCYSPRQRYLLKVFDALVADGLLVGKQMLVLAALIDHGPATSGEILKAIPDVTNANAWRGRFTELQSRGLIREVGLRRCRVGPRKAVVWEATGRARPLDPDSGIAPSKLGRWKMLADQMATVLRGAQLTGNAPAHTAHLMAQASRALAEYKRLGGKE